jgi:hypothetical protein
MPCVTLARAGGGPFRHALDDGTGGAQVTAARYEGLRKNTGPRDARARFRFSSSLAPYLFAISSLS